MVDSQMTQQAAEKAADAPQSPADPSAERSAAEPIGFNDLVRMLATQALLYLGQIPDPQTGKAVVALDVAKLNIDLLETLRDKTKGNLTEDESTMLERTAHELRLAFVEIADHIRRAQAEGKIGPDGQLKVDAPPPGQGPGVPPGGFPQ